MQLAMFDAPSMSAAHAAADLGISRAAERVNSVSPGWIAAAVNLLRDYALVAPTEPFTIEQARVYSQCREENPPELRVWGAVVREAKKLGYIERVKGGYMPAASSHGSPKPTWRAGANA